MKLLKVFLSAVIGLGLATSTAFADEDLSKQQKLALLESLTTQLNKSEIDLQKANNRQALGKAIVGASTMSGLVSTLAAAANCFELIFGTSDLGSSAAKKAFRHGLEVATAIGIGSYGNVQVEISTEDANRLKGEINRLQGQIDLYRKALMQIQE